MDLPPLRDPGFLRPFALVCSIVTAVALAAAALIYLFKLVLLLVLSCVLAVLFTTIADPLAERLRGPRTLYVTLAFLVVLAGFGGLIALFVVPLVDQGEHLLDEVPRLVAKTERLLGGDTLAPATERAPSVGETVTEKLPGVAASGIPWAIDTLEGAFDVLGAVFFGLFMAISPDLHRSGFRRLWPATYQPRIDALIDEAHDVLRAWLGAVAIGMTIVGTLMTIGLYVIGVEDWLIFGAFSAGMELVPYAGPFLGFLGPFLAAVLNGEPRQAALVVGLYAGVQALMMNVISPYLVKRRTDIPASLAIVSILLLGRACGAIGVLAAVPFVAIVLAALRTLPERPLPRLAPVAA